MNQPHQPKQTQPQPQMPEQPPQQTARKPTRMWIFAPVVILISLACFALSAYVLFFMDPPAKEATNNNSNQQQTQETARTLYYAYTEGKSTKIAKIAAGADSSEEIFTFTEASELTSSDFYYFKKWLHTANLSFDLKNLLYISNNDVISYDITNDTKKTLVDTSEGAEIKYGGRQLNATPSLTTQGVMALYNPVWAKNGKAFSVHALQYEGGGVELFDVTKNAFVKLGDTFRYAPTGAHVTDTLTAVAGNEPLATYGLNADRLIKEDADNFNNLVVSDDGKTIFASLCPLNTTSEGNYSSDTTDKQQRDCGEPAPASLISVDAAGGTIKKLADIAPQSKIAVYNGLVYSLDENSKAVMINPTSGSEASDSVDILSIAGVKPADAKRITLDALQRPLASIYTVNPSAGGTVTVVDVQDKKVLAKLELAKISDFYVLGVTP